MPQSLINSNKQAQISTAGPFMPGAVLASAGGGVGSNIKPKPRLLIVEDDYFTAALYQTGLEQSGYEVVGIAGSFEEAVSTSDAERPDLIIMDIRLVGPKDGVEAAVEIMERFGIRCLFASAFVDSKTRSRAEAARPVGWLAKPFAIDQLIETIRHAIDQLRPSSQ